MNTELYNMTRNERKKAIHKMETGLLFEELDDTINFDILEGEQSRAWNDLDSDMYVRKKVYIAIINELRTRWASGCRHAFFKNIFKHRR